MERSGHRNRLQSVLGVVVVGRDAELLHLFGALGPCEGDIERATAGEWRAIHHVGVAAPTLKLSMTLEAAALSFIGLHCLAAKERCCNFGKEGKASITGRFWLWQSGGSRCFACNLQNFLF